MRKLLNTVYVTNEQAYLALDGENLVCRVDNEVAFRIPFDNVEGIVCFSYLGCSPALMGKCVEKLIPISFVSPSGKFLAKVVGETKGNVFLRVAQIDVLRENALQLAKNTVAAKIINTVSLIKRSRHDYAALRDDQKLNRVIEQMVSGIESVWNADSVDTVLGIEGNCAHQYFSIFDKLLTNKSIGFTTRNSRPPLDPVNAVLSFLYTLFTNEYASALETVGLDSYIGFYHALRSGRSSLACDLVEETRCIVERTTLTLFNLGMLKEEDFDVQISSATLLNSDGRRKVIAHWQEKKRTDIYHPVLKEKIQLGLLPYVQSNLLAKYVRNEAEEYPCFLVK